MILYFILQGLISLLYFIITPILALPDVTLPNFILSNIQMAGNWISIFNNFLPIENIIIIIASFLSIETLLFAYKVIKWIYIKIPGIN